MRKYILPILLIAGILIFSFAIYIYSKGDSPPSSDSLSILKLINNKDSNIINNSNSDKNKDSSKTISSEGSKGSSGGGGGSGGGAGGSGGSGGDSGSIPVEERANESTCVLIRPGNLPDVKCSVDYIKKDSVSLEIENKLGEDIGINLDLNTCSPKIQDEIKSSEIKNFIFYCNNNDYFNEDIVITYILKENGNVSIGGFVNGPVE